MTADSRDPRHRNEIPEAASVSDYLIGYQAMVNQALGTVDPGKLAEAQAVLEKVAREGGRVLAAGNGGSAAIADHLCCDWMKGTHVPGKPTLKVHSLVANVPVATALANDFGFENGIARHLEMLGEIRDVLVLVSSSGNSPNILRAAEAARSRNIFTLGLTGFSGGKLREAADLSLHVSSNNYGVVEDCHQILMHVLTQFLARSREEKA